MYHPLNIDSSQAEALGLDLQLVANFNEAQNSKADLHRLIEDHKRIYMTLAQSRSKDIRPMVDALIAANAYALAYDVCNELPDTIHRTLLFKHINDSEEANKHLCKECGYPMRYHKADHSLHCEGCTNKQPVK